MFDLVLPGSGKTVREIVDAWDSGAIITVASLGGLGPSYDQAIYILLFELLRDREAYGEAAIGRCDPTCRFSGTQVSSARGYANAVLVNGWDAVLERYGRSSYIQVSRWFPTAPPGNLHPAAVPHGG